MRNVRKGMVRTVWLVLVATATLFLVDSAHAEDPIHRRPDCQDLIQAIVNATVRRLGGLGSECFETDLPTGHLELDVTMPDPGAAEARIDFLGRICEAAESVESVHRFLEAAATSLRIELRESGRFAFCVLAQDSRLLLGEYKLRVAFVKTLPHKSEDPAEQEPDPDPVVYPMADELDQLCRSGEVDDHGNTRRCATPIALGQTAKGDLANDWGDDEDFFMFFIGGGLRPTVEIVIDAELAVRGELHDRYGYRLAEGGGDGNVVRMVKTLSGPGWFYVRIHGGVDRVEGPYRLAVRPSSHR